MLILSLEGLSPSEAFFKLSIAFSQYELEIFSMKKVSRKQIFVAVFLTIPSGIITFGTATNGSCHLFWGVIDMHRFAQIPDFFEKSGILGLSTYLS
jgi:hypothetical protein